MTARTNNSKNKQRRKQKQIPFGDDNQTSKGKDKQRQNAVVSLGLARMKRFLLGGMTVPR
jgi:hypothetical protein